MPEQADNPLGHMHILVADDNSVNRLIVKTIIGKFGGRYDFACDGDEAVAKGVSQGYDAVIMDIHMPKIDGIEAMELIKSQKPGLPIIAITADAGGNTAQQLLQAGFDACLSKPIQESSLLDILLGSNRKTIDDPNRTEVLNEPQTDPRYDEAKALNAAGGNKALAEKILKMFLADLQEKREIIERPTLSESQLLDVAHIIHGGAVYCGAEQVKTRAARLESALLKGSDEIELNSLKQALLDSIKEFLKLKASLLNS